MNLNQLIKNCLQNDRKAQFALYDQFVGRVSNVCERYSRDIPTAKDNVQSTFIKIFQKLNTYDSSIGAFEAWIKRIAINECLSTYRKNHRVMLIPEMSTVYEPIELPDYGASIDNEKLIKIVQELPLGYQTIFLLYAVDGYRHKEIAEQLGISENTSRTQLFKARQVLKKKLEHWNTLNKVV